MTTAKDEWMTAAMADDRVVVEVLIQLKQAQSSATPRAVVPLRWGLRLPRSRQCDRKDRDFPARCSPTTPLSWSGGGGSASPSAAADGFEETSRRRSSRSPTGFRSKGRLIVIRIMKKLGKFRNWSGASTNQETTNTDSASATATKRSRRKKTFAELKEEEGLLMEESIHLRKEIENLNATFKEQTARNDNLKRIKIDLNLQCEKLSNFPSSTPEELKEVYSQPSSCDSHDGVSNHDRSFLLPDLNSLPFEEDL